QSQLKRRQPLAVFPHSFGKENPLGNHVFAQRSSSSWQKIDFENAQSNTMVCKERMNFVAAGKKLRAPREPNPAGHFGIRLSDAYFAAATELTVMVLPLSVPVTVTFAPACLSSVARAALSVVSRV